MAKRRNAGPASIRKTKKERKKTPYRLRGVHPSKIPSGSFPGQLKRKRSPNPRHLLFATKSAANAYAKAHGITLIIDGSQVPILYAAESMDVTKAFITEYNLKNPATAQATLPK